jgi:hypothetical protein
VDGARETEVAKLTRTLKLIDERIRPLYLTKEKLEALKKQEQTFYHSIYFGSINIFGDGNEQI